MASVGGHDKSCPYTVNLYKLLIVRESLRNLRQLPYDLLRVGGYYEFFVCGDDIYFHAAVFGGNVDDGVVIFFYVFVFFFIYRRVQEFKPVDDALADVGVVLAYAGGEHYRVEAPHCGGV